MLRENPARPAPPPHSRFWPLAILSYHSINSVRSPITISRERFRSQMAELQRAGLRGVSLGEALSQRQRPVPGRRMVALTFDDGFADFATEAWPVLKDAGFGATVFLVTGRLGSNNDWPGQPSWAPRLPLLSRGSVRKLSREGVEFGAHSVNHPWLPALSPDVVSRELDMSRQAIEAATDSVCPLFAYPYGAVTSSLRMQVAEHFSAAVTTELRLATGRDDRYLLPRVDTVYLGYRGLTGAIYHSTVGAYLAVRRAGRGLRRALLLDR